MKNPNSLPDLQKKINKCRKKKEKIQIEKEKKETQ